MPVTPHPFLVQIFIILVTLAVVFCFPQVDLGLQQTVGDNQLATGDFYASNIDDAPPPLLADIFQHLEIQKFLQWIHPPQPPKCDNGLSAFCCNWPAPNPNIGIQRPLHVDPEEVKKRRRKCGIWNKDRPGCLIPENNFCCDCKDVNNIAYNCYNPFYRDDPRFQGKPEPKPSPIGHPLEQHQPAPQEPDLDEHQDFYRDAQGEATGGEENDRIEQRAILPSTTNKIKSGTSTTRSPGVGVGRTGADRQLPRAWKRAQPQAANDGDDPDGNGEDVELLRAWKRAQPAVPDGDNPDGTGEDVEIMRAWKRLQPAVPAVPTVPDSDSSDGTGSDAQLLRAWKRVQPAVPTVPDGDGTEGAGADAQLLRAWKRSTQPTSSAASTGGKNEQQLIKRVWQREAQPEISVADDEKNNINNNREKIFPNDAQILSSPAWQRSSQSWIGGNVKGSDSSSVTGEGGEIEGAVEHYYYDGSTTTVRNLRDNDSAMCEKKYLENLGIFS